MSWLRLRLFKGESSVKETLMAAVFTLHCIMAHLLHPLLFYLNPNGDIYSEWQTRQLFQNWCKEYRKTYPSEKEKLYRFGIFKKTLEQTTRRNRISDSHCAGTNGFADRTSEELDYLLPFGSFDDDDIEEEFYESLRKRPGIYRVYEENDQVLVHCSGTNASLENVDDEKFFESLRQQEPGFTYRVYEKNGSIWIDCFHNDRVPVTF